MTTEEAASLTSNRDEGEEVVKESKHNTTNINRKGQNGKWMLRRLNNMT